MSCIINAGWPLGCRDSIGGVQRILIKSFVASETYTYDLAGIVTASSIVSPPSMFYEINQSQETVEFTQAGQHSVENGTNFWQQTVNLVFHKYQASLRDLVYVLAQKEVVILVQDQNGKWFIIGEQNGANLTASTGNVGKAYGDLNGATVSFLGKEPSPAREVASAYITSLVIM